MHQIAIAAPSYTLCEMKARVLAEKLKILEIPIVSVSRRMIQTEHCVILFIPLMGYDWRGLRVDASFCFPDDIAFYINRSHTLTPPKTSILKYILDKER